MLEDIAVLIGGQLISEDLGLKLENVELDALGTAKRIVIDKDTTTVVQGAGQALLQDGFDGFLSKPFEVRELIDLMETQTQDAPVRPSV